MADLHLYPIFERLPAICKLGFDVFPADKYPVLTAWTSTMQQLDFVRKIWYSPVLYKNFIVGRKAGFPEYDVELDGETVETQKSVA